MSLEAAAPALAVATIDPLGAGVTDGSAGRQATDARIGR
jgi:hypothetical protein